MTDIRTLPDPILRAVAQPVSNFGTEQLKAVVDMLLAAMRAKDGVGIAAPQLGISQRIFVYGFDSSPRYPNVSGIPIGYAINPEIIWRSDTTWEREEGCLSVPYQRGVVTRANEVSITYFDINGIQHERTFTDFAARIVQHEIDHLNGILYIDRTKEVRPSELY